jgi:parvulin-like peptidyl-prolyl isomerase
MHNFVISKLKRLILFWMVIFISIGETPVHANNIDVVATVNGSILSLLELNRAKKVLLRGQTVPAEKQAEIDKQALEQLISAELLYQVASKLKIADLNKQIDAKLAQGRARFTSEQEFAKAIKDLDMDERALREYTRKDLLISKFVESEIAAKITVREEDALAFYSKNPDKFLRSETVKASHILIGVDAKASAEEKKKALKKAEDLHKELAGGADFATLAKANSSCPSSQQGGDLGFFGKGQMVPSFEKAVFALKPGEISDVVETQFGYHIIKLTDKKGTEKAEFKEVRARVEEYLMGQKINAAVAEYLSEAKKTAKIEVFDKLMVAYQQTPQTGSNEISSVNQLIPSAPPDISVSIAFIEPSGNNILDADETGKLLITLKNNGKGDAIGVIANISSKQIAGLNYDRNITIGTVKSGITLTKEIEIMASEEILSDSLTLDVELKEANGFDPIPQKISFQTLALTPPKLIVSDIGISDQNGGSNIKPGTIVEAIVRIQNIGNGDARNVSTVVIKGNNVFMTPDSKSRFELGNIPSGQFKDIKFSFYTNNRIRNGENIPLSVDILEARPRFNANKQLALIMNAPQKSSQEFVLKPVESGKKAEIQLAGGLSVDVDQNIPEGEKAGKYDVAVVIGNKNYSVSGAPDVDYANRDAQVMRDYLIRTMGFDTTNILYTEDATYTHFIQIFGNESTHEGKLYNMVMKGKSNIFVYYVGHGAPDAESSEAYFVPVDANPQMLKISGYRLQTFYDNLAKMGAKKVTVIIDACFSGATPKGTLFKGTSALVRKEKAARQPDNAIVISSSSGEQFSSWYPEKRHSLFTYYFLKGLSGDADSNKDARITVGEMKEYLTEHVPYMARRLTGNKQSPQVIGQEGDVLAILKK